MVALHYERDFDMIFHFKVAQNLIADHYERYFDLIFHFMADQNLVAEHYEIDFDMFFNITGLTAAQNMVADFDMIFCFEACLKHGCIAL